MLVRDSGACDGGWWIGTWGHSELRKGCGLLVVSCCVAWLDIAKKVVMCILNRVAQRR